MQQIAQWLEKLGMSEYVTQFAENRVDFSVLRDLTDQDLKDLGVVLGDRRKLLRAIGELDVAPAPTPAILGDLTSQDGAERRQLTLMFCDLVGSTALSTRLDVEDLREIIGAYHRCCAKLVEDNGGFVAKYMGDGVLVYFGYPRAHEHDAERAVQVGLALVEAVPKLVTAADVPLQVRVGIATGLVVVGDLLGSGEAQERSVVGETPNLAARLQGVAEPDMVVIAESTRRLIGNLFELRDLGTQELKGIAGPVLAWAALRANSDGSRFEAFHGTGMTALVGREEESELLLRRWASATTGAGQTVLISGDAGIGKSRLTAGFLEHLATEPHAQLRYFCSPQHTDSALYPFIGQMERTAGLARDDIAQAKLDKLDATLASTSTSTEDAALLAEMLSLPNDGRYPALNLTSPQRRQKTLEALVAQMEALACAGPVLMFFEDAHWSDPTSLEVLGRAIDRIVSLRVLLIVTFRPEFEPPWIGRTHVSAITINRLAQHDVYAMIDRVAGGKTLPAGVRRDIVERADGVPLFVEEMTKAVLEAEGEGEARRTAAAVPSPALAVPASLQASLMARLDRLGPAKEVAQIGAAIGREFSYALLASVVRKPEFELQSALDRLVATGLLFPQSVPPHATYLFNHALVQDAAYGTLLREPRRALHARIAETLEKQFANITESHPELLARHYTEAGLSENAARLWGRAGQRSLARSALIEAAEQLARALGQIAALPGTPALRREQIKLQVDLANGLIHTKGHAAPETKASFDKARALIERSEALGEAPEDPLLLFSVLYGFWVVNRMTFKADAARELAAQFQTLAQKQRATAPLVIGNLITGISLVLMAGAAEGRAYLDRAIALYDPVEHRPLATRFGHDVRMTAFAWRAFAQWALGAPEGALADTEHALKDAREIGHAATLMYALSHTSLTLIYCGDYAAATILIDELAALAEEKDAVFWKGYGTLLRGGLFALTGKAADAVDVITSGIAAVRSTGATAYAPWYLSNLAKAYARIGQFDDAWGCLGEAMTAAETTGEKWCEADIYRFAGEITLMSPEPDAAKAEAYFERALSVARRQKAKSFELRATMSIVRLWREQGKQKQARDLLAPVYNWFTEGLDTFDLAEAKALLDASSS
jgi:class 3 adenylate cyclase/predicted ATPase